MTDRHVKSVARLAPPGVDARAVAPQAAAAFDALARLQNLTQRVLADLDRDAGTSPPAAPADLDDLQDRWEITAFMARRTREPRDVADRRSTNMPVHVYRRRHSSTFEPEQRITGDALVTPPVQPAETPADPRFATQRSNVP